MESPPLAPVYLDNEPVGLHDDPRPRVAAVLAASGRPPEHFAVLWRQDQEGDAGALIGLEEVLDRTEAPTVAIYLTTVAPETDADLEGEVESGPGVSGEGNEAGSLQSAYSRTGTDTAGPGMIAQEADAAGFGSGAGKGASSGARESGKATPATPSAEDGRSRMAAGLEDPFGKEGLSGKVDKPGLGVTSPVRPRAASGTGSEPAAAEASAPEGQASEPR
ncbi:MAG: hypothetical protein QOI63_1165 [Thermoplasmata archaeon]|jgi:hypothetical protein|nr:hypothetical protein [Thermoplasmata archaeon]